MTRGQTGCVNPLPHAPDLGSKRSGLIEFFTTTSAPPPLQSAPLPAGRAWHQIEAGSPSNHSAFCERWMNGAPASRDPMPAQIIRASRDACTKVKRHRAERHRQRLLLQTAGLHKNRSFTRAVTIAHRPIFPERKSHKDVMLCRVTQLMQFARRGALCQPSQHCVSLVVFHSPLLCMAARISCCQAAGLPQLCIKQRAWMERVNSWHGAIRTEARLV